jgi:hypothetical protein
LVARTKKCAKTAVCIYEASALLSRKRKVAWNLCKEELMLVEKIIRPTVDWMIEVPVVTSKKRPDGTAHAEGHGGGSGR